MTLHSSLTKNNIKTIKTMVYKDIEYTLFDRKRFEPIGGEEFYIYVLKFADHNKVKIGITKSVLERVRKIETSSGYKVSHATVRQVSSEHAMRSIERKAFNVLWKYRDIGEYFTCSYEECVKVITNLIDWEGGVNIGTRE